MQEVFNQCVNEVIAFMGILELEESSAFISSLAHSPLNENIELNDIHGAGNVNLSLAGSNGRDSSRAFSLALF